MIALRKSKLSSQNDLLFLQNFLLLNCEYMEEKEEEQKRFFENFLL